MANKIITWIKASDYDKLQKFDEIELVVEAKNRKGVNDYDERL